MAATSIPKLLTYRRSDDRELLTLAMPVARLGAGSTGSSLAVPIGFTFRFDGVSYTTIDLFAYGFARLAGTEATATNANLFASNTSVILAPWWDNLQTAVSIGYVRTTTTGTAPRQRFIAEWCCYLQAGQLIGAHDRVTFQVVLYELSDRIDFRYGALITTGSPSRASYSASMGVKGDTSSVASNRRSCAVDDLALGGSDTDTTSTLAAPAAWPAYTVVIEPAWPNCGRAVFMDLDQLAGIQDPYAEPAWAIAATTNWLIGHHTPALVNISPWQETAALVNEYITPCTPSVDGLTYRVWVQTHEGGDRTVEIAGASGLAAQPGDPSGWVVLGSAAAPGPSSGWLEWTPFDVVIPADVSLLRIVVTGTNNMLVGSVLIAPAPFDDVEDLTYASGITPVCIAQIRQEGAAIHPEYYNRAWRTIGLVIEGRKQMLWSSLWPQSVGIEAEANMPRRRIAVTSAYLPPELGRSVVVRTYARSDGGDATVSFSEIGGSTLTFQELDRADYHLQSQALELIAGEPELSCDTTPGIAELSPMAVVVEWTPRLSSADLIIGVTPPPRFEYLVRMAARLELAVRAYSMTGLALGLSRGKSTTNPTRLQILVPPGVKTLRAKVARVQSNNSSSAGDTTIYAPSSGLAPQDELVLPAPFSSGRDDYPPDGSYQPIASAMVDEPSPTGAMDRLLESPTSTTLTGAVRERVEVVRGVGFCAVPILADIRSL